MRSDSPRKFIRATRLKLGLTQKQAGEIFGGGINAFSRYERGVAAPSKALLALFALLDENPGLMRKIAPDLAE